MTQTQTLPTEGDLVHFEDAYGVTITVRIKGDPEWQFEEFGVLNGVVVSTSRTTPKYNVGDDVSRRPDEFEEVRR